MGEVRVSKLQTFKVLSRRSLPPRPGALAWVSLQEGVGEVGVDPGVGVASFSGVRSRLDSC